MSANPNLRGICDGCGAEDVLLTNCDAPPVAVGLCLCAVCLGSSTPDMTPVKPGGDSLTSALHDFIAERFEGVDVFDIAGALMTTGQGFIASSVPPQEQQRVYDACLRQMERNWPKVRTVFHHTAG